MKLVIFCQANHNQIIYKTNTVKVNIIISCFCLLVLSACGTGYQYEKTPLDDIITTYINEPNYSVILADMNYDESADKYSHKYTILIEKPYQNVDDAVRNDSTRQASDVEVVNMDWQEVDAIHFEKHVEDLGMVLLSKKNGILDKNTSPAGLDNYVGNERYGHWQTHSNGSSFWVFYGQYHFLSRLFCGPGYYYPRSIYGDYHSGYRGRRSFYGSGNNSYGTKSSRNRNTTWSKRPATFKNSVRSRVKRSASTLKSRRYSSRSRYSRKGSRYSSRPSRSRGGGFGK